MRIAICQSPQCSRRAPVTPVVWKTLAGWLAAAMLLIGPPYARPADAAATANGPYQATGVKIGEMTQTSAIIWTRLTSAPKRLEPGIPWPRSKSKAAEEGEGESVSSNESKAAKAASAPAKEESGKKSGAKKATGKKSKTKKAGKSAVVASQMPDGATLEQMEGFTPGAPGETRVVYWAPGAPAQPGALAQPGAPAQKGAAAQKPVETSWERVDPSRDFTRQFELTGLKPATQYQFRVESRAKADSPLGQTIEGHFTTAPDPSAQARVVFTVVTGTAYNDIDDPAGFKIYREMLKVEPSFFVHTGDILYYDGSRPVVQNIAMARYEWNRHFSFDTLREFHRQVPSYFEKDDHDTWQNDCWPTMQNEKMGEFTFKEGQGVFLEQCPMGEHTWRTVRWGKDLQVWMPEGRDFRSANTDPDGPDKSIWGAAQKDWFKKTVQESDATFRVLINETPLVGPDRDAKGDNHANKAFKTEGDELRKFIASQKNMYICCGDRHWQYVSVDPVSGAREYSCGPASNAHAGGWSLGLIPEYHKYLNVTGGFLCGVVERLDGKPTLTFRHYGVDGKILHEDRLSAK